MQSLRNIFYFYYDGFRQMVLGKTLWKLILIKLAVIFLFLNYIIYDKSFNTEYDSFSKKADFVKANLAKN
ncbi:MAG: DUF4492 domain-containing protein [Campylobacterota bacterium]